MRRIMIIVWRWGGKQFKSKGKPIVNDNYLRRIPSIVWEKELGIVQYLQDRQFIDEYTVQDKETESFSINKDIIVRLNINNSALTQKLLMQVISYYSKSGNSILLFLHRKNLYNQDDVKRIQSNFSNNLTRIFLFGEGRDFIYFHTQRLGLLGGSGYFMENNEYEWEEIHDGKKSKCKMAIRVADDEEKVVYQKYFDAVWEYYQVEIKKKSLN